MTGRTGAWRDSNVFEGSSRPAHGPMAAIAGHGRRNMSSRLACRDSLVVAFGTGSRSHAIVRKERGRPICCPVAAVAIDGGRYVIRRFERGHDSSAGRVALHTLRGGSPKDALKVAALTLDLGVAAAKLEAGTAVIELDIRAATSLGRRGIRHQQHRAAYRQKPGNSCRGKEMMSCPASHSSHSCTRHCATSLGGATFIIGIIGIMIPITRSALSMRKSWECGPKHTDKAHG